MTIIIGSLFLPYTVQFKIEEDVGEKEVADIESKLIHERSRSGSTKPIVPQDGSILQSLSLANSRQATPLDSEPSDRRTSYSDSKEAGEDLFSRHRLGSLSSSPGSQLDLLEKNGTQYIQPKSRYKKMSVSSSVIEPKKENDDLGLPALKINRSSTNSPSINRRTSKANLPAHTISRVRNSLSKPFPPLTYHPNTSSGSLAIEDEEVHSDDSLTDEWKNDFNNMVNGRSVHKLAPYGGFSNPAVEDVLFKQENIFETAPWEVSFGKKGNISLTKAVKLSEEDRLLGDVKWVGTVAMPVDALPIHVVNDISTKLSKEYSCEAIFPDDLTFQGHYRSYCKQILWPTMHYQIPDDPKSKTFEDHSWGHYCSLNQLVANKLVEIYKRENGDSDPRDPNNAIWIHDYHLLLVPRMVRDLLPDVKIGFFLHVSFPSSEVFRCLPQREALLRGMLGANSIAFQTEEYVRHFHQTSTRILLSDSNAEGVSFEGRFSTTKTTCVGINAKSLYEVVESETVTEWAQVVRERWPDKKLIVSRDKLDKLRGIKQKLLAYERLLKEEPELIEKAVFIQILIGSVQDTHYEAEVMHIVSRINSITENISDTPPVILIQKNLEFEQYLALLREADVFVVASMREGLNLTCHEFITATTEKKSPLVLSEFTGSSPLLDLNGQGALLINPWDISSFSETLKRLLHMTKKEKEMRWEKCFQIVHTHDSKSWVMRCLKSIDKAYERDRSRFSSTIKPYTPELFDDFYSRGQSGTRLFILNLEVPSQAIRDINLSEGKGASFTETRISSLLNNLLSDSHNHVYILSVLKRADLGKLYSRSPNLGLIAENGGYIRLVNSKKWVSIVDESETHAWMQQAIQLMNSKAERLPGSFVEVEDCTVRFHTGSSFADSRVRSLDAMGDCMQHINDLFQENDGIHATVIRNLVVVQQNELALKAFKFLLSYYNRFKNGNDPYELVDRFKLRRVPSTKTDISKDKKEYSVDKLLSKKGELNISSVFLSGAPSPIIEPCFQHLNFYQEIPRQNKATVALINLDQPLRTSADTAIPGKNELMSILSSK